jgi:hypothetical protein
VAVAIALAVLLSPLLMAGVLISPLPTRQKVILGIVAVVVLVALPLFFLIFGDVFGS